MAIAKAFGMPVLLNAEERDGSLRQTSSELGVKVILYEAGQALRYDEFSIRAGVKGIINVMREIGMLNKRQRLGKQVKVAGYEQVKVASLIMSHNWAIM